MPLPFDILQKRVRNEIEMCKHHLSHEIVLSDVACSKFPVEVNVTLLKTPGPIMQNGKIKHRYTHKLKLIITENYPYQKPIVKWQSEIFHPNIMLPEDGGYLCTKLLDEWNFTSSLLAFIKGIESLLVNPNPRKPFGNDSCTRAAEYFNKHHYKPPILVTKSRVPRIISDGEK